MYGTLDTLITSLSTVVFINLLQHVYTTFTTLFRCESIPYIIWCIKNFSYIKVNLMYMTYGLDLFFV